MTSEIKAPHGVTFTLTAVVSADGFIARRAGEHPGAWASAEEQARFLAEVPRYDWAFMGRSTHRTAFRRDRRRVVFSRSAARLEWREPSHLWVDPAKISLPEILAALKPVRPAHRCIVLGGTAVHDWFLERRLIDRIELSIEPLRFDSGLPLLTGQGTVDLPALLARHGFALVDEQRLNAAGTRLLILAKRSGPDRAMP